LEIHRRTDTRRPIRYILRSRPKRREERTKLREKRGRRKREGEKEGGGEEGEGDKEE